MFPPQAACNPTSFMMCLTTSTTFGQTLARSKMVSLFTISRPLSTMEYWETSGSAFQLELALFMECAYRYLYRRTLIILVRNITLVSYFVRLCLLLKIPDRLTDRGDSIEIRPAVAINERPSAGVFQCTYFHLHRSYPQAGWYVVVSL